MHSAVVSHLGKGVGSFVAPSQNQRSEGDMSVAPLPTLFPDGARAPIKYTTKPPNTRLQTDRASRLSPLQRGG